MLVLPHFWSLVCFSIFNCEQTFLAPKPRRGIMEAEETGWQNHPFITLNSFQVQCRCSTQLFYLDKIRYNYYSDLIGRCFENGFHFIVKSSFHFLWFCITMLSDRLKKTRATLLSSLALARTRIRTRSHTFSRATRQLQVFISSFGWFTGPRPSWLATVILALFVQH